MRKSCNSFLLTSQFLHVSQVLNFFGFYMNSLKKSNSITLTFRMMLGAEKKGHKKSYGHAMKRWFAPKKVVEAQNNRTIFGRFFKYRNGHHLAHKKQTPQFFCVVKECIPTSNNDLKTNISRNMCNFGVW